MFAFRIRNMATRLQRGDADAHWISVCIMRCRCELGNDIGTRRAFVDTKLQIISIPSDLNALYPRSRSVIKADDDKSYIRLGNPIGRLGLAYPAGLIGRNGDV
jgi:hypothetical protein